MSAHAASFSTSSFGEGSFSLSFSFSFSLGFGESSFDLGAVVSDLDLSASYFEPHAPRHTARNIER
jgi:hypothetical protein